MMNRNLVSPIFERTQTAFRSKKSTFVLMALVATVALGVSATSGQQAAVQAVTSAPSEQQERDVWRGSSLGIRLELEDRIPVVTSIYPHVASSSPFLEQDKIVAIESLKFPEAEMEALGDLLSACDPGSELTATVERDGEQLQLNVMTFRKAFVDIQAIYRRLHKNKIIAKHLQDTDRPDYFDDFVDRMVSSVRQSPSPRLAAESLNRIIDEIGVSHTAIIPASAGLSMSGEAKGSLGIVLQRQTVGNHSGYFVIDCKPGGPSALSELMLGDEILAINRVELQQSRRLVLSGHEDRHQLFTLQADIDEELEIEYLRSPFEDSQMTSIVARKDLTTVESVQESCRVIEVGKAQFGYLRFWNLMSMRIGTEFSKKTKNEFADCDVIIMDLRGRGGIVPVVISLNRTVGKLDRPVVVIIDRLTRSAKEMLAYLLKKQQNVVVIGETTAGAVTGATMMKLPSGNSLMFPVASADSLKQFVDGAIIEGVGVAPDEKVPYFLPYAAGQDRLLNFAIKKAESLAKGKAGVVGRD